jgi:uncharacterized protein YkwD
VLEARADPGTCGADSLETDPALVAVAQDCADMMAGADSLAACDGTIEARLAAHSISAYSSAGEVQAWNRTAARALDGLLADAATARHLLDCDFSVVGIAIAPDPDQSMVYVCISLLAP